MVNGETGRNTMYILVDNINRIFTRSSPTYIKINKNKCFLTSFIHYPENNLRLLKYNRNDIVSIESNIYLDD